MPTNLPDLATQIQDISKRLGIGKYDIYGAAIDETSVQVDQGEPKQVKASNRSSVTVRVWKRRALLALLQPLMLIPLA